MTIKRNVIECADALTYTRALPNESVNCVVTSPPYWQQRRYGSAGEWGCESTSGQYIENIVTLFAEIRRVLRTDGTCWLNLGDKYETGTSGAGGYTKRRMVGTAERFTRGVASAEEFAAAQAVWSAAEAVWTAQAAEALDMARCSQCDMIRERIPDARNAPPYFGPEEEIKRLRTDQ